ncbi:hypothetical protein ACFPVV_01730 [Macrococcoides bohemicum]|uniref:Uncharacterized protein n=1 Tax=Macrococcoides bohemicum TaxID=1903056 RepID=A0A328A6N2_9STAP|nr:hypothetical protein BHX94_01700 [Macrococcus bohemicus]
MLRSKSPEESLNEIPWDFYIYIAMSQLNWSWDFFWYSATPNLWLKQYLMFVKYNNPEAIDEKQSSGTKVIEASIDECPLFN